MIAFYLYRKPYESVGNTNIFLQKGGEKFFNTLLTNKIGVD